MRVISGDDLDRILTFPAIIGALREGFTGEITAPVRHHHTIERKGAANATHLLMSAWSNAAKGKNYLGTKVVNVFPDNGKRGLPSIHGAYLLMSGETGETLAAIDGTRLTAWRTAGTSALAATYLAAPKASRMVMIGAGALAPSLIWGHACYRPIRHVSLWNHNHEKAEDLAIELAPKLAKYNIILEAVEQLEPAVRQADIVSCATLADQPIVRGEWLKPGAHLDLVGSYNPAMREADDACITRSKVFVDTYGGALKEAGDLVQPLNAGLIKRSDIQAELAELCKGSLQFKRKPDDITLFKSVGAAVEDLAAAMLVWKMVAG